MQEQELPQFLFIIHFLSTYQKKIQEFPQFVLYPSLLNLTSDLLSSKSLNCFMSATYIDVLVRNISFFSSSNQVTSSKIIPNSEPKD